MKAFWWFEEGEIAGMARPGFNGAHWYDIPFDEVLLFGWLGLLADGTYPFIDLQAHVDGHSKKIAHFYDHDEIQRRKVVDTFSTSKGAEQVAERLISNTHVMKAFGIAGGQVHVEFSGARLSYEISFLKDHGFSRIAALTEIHHNTDVLEEHFELHHFSIEDLDAPSLEQVREMGEIVKAAKQNREPLAIHCMAGIGRTSTMIIAAHVALGEKLDGLLQKISEQNPTFSLTGKQAAFIHSIESQLRE